MFDLKSYRKRHNLSQSELGELLGVQKTIISQVENGVKPLPDRWLYVLEDKLGIDADEIIKDSKIKSEVTQVSFDEFMEVPVVTVNAQAGYLFSLDNDNKHFVNELEKMLVPKEFEKGYYIVIEVNGDSMDDGTSRAICSGEKLLCKELQKIHWRNKLHFRQYIFIIVSNEGIVCKQITNHNMETGEILCHSWNPMFEDYTVNLNDVIQLFYVKKVVERRIRF